MDATTMRSVSISITARGRRSHGFKRAADLEDEVAPSAAESWPVAFDQHDVQDYHDHVASSTSALSGRRS